MVDATIHRDAEGRAVLTTEQAVLCARYEEMLHTAGLGLDDEQWEAVYAIEAELGGTGELFAALARWVLRWAPVVQAAQAQEEAISHMTAKPGGASVWTESDYARWQGATDATERAVRAARGEGEPPP